MLGLTPAAGSRRVSRTPPLCEGPSGVQQWATAGSRSTASSSSGSDSGAITLAVMMLPRPARAASRTCYEACTMIFIYILSGGLLKKAATCLTKFCRRDVLLHEMCCSMKSNPSLLGMMTCSQGGGQQRTNASAHTDDPARQVWSEQVRGVVRSPRAAVAAQGLQQACRIGASGRGTNG